MSHTPCPPDKLEHPRRAAFTLVELLVVIGIIAVLISILLPSLNKAQQQAKTVQCMNNLRQIGICYENYVIDNKGYGFLYGFADPSASTPTTKGISYWFANCTANLSTYTDTYDATGGFLRPYFQDSRITDCPACTDEPFALSSYGVPRVAYAYNYINMPTTMKFSQCELPDSTWALYDSASFPSGVYQVWLQAQLNSTKAPSFQGRHSGGMGNVLWYDGHVTSERPYICHLSTSYYGSAAPYFGAYIQANIGMLVPFTPSQVPESTLVFSSGFNSANPTNLNYYGWWNKDNQQ